MESWPINRNKPLGIMSSILAPNILKYRLTKEELEEAIASSQRQLVVLDFFAEWCGPCKRVAPELEKICTEYEDVVFVKLNVDEVESAAETYAISAMPTFILFRGGKQVDTHVGANMDNLRSLIEKYK